MRRRKIKPFWVIDCESDPFEPWELAVQRRECPSCGVAPGVQCRVKKNETIDVHDSRRRKPQPFIWGAYDGENFYEFEKVSDVVAFFERRKTVVYAHNGGKFDYQFLRADANTAHIEWKTVGSRKQAIVSGQIAIIGSRLAKFKIGECEFRDSFNLLPVALKAYKKDDIDYSIMEPGARDDPNNRATIRRYLRSDCVYLHELISEHKRENGTVLTQATASMRSLAKIQKIKPPRQTPAEYAKGKPYFYGGRVQCYVGGDTESAVGTGDFVVIDINSAYPHAMKSPHPFSTKATVQTKLPKDSEIHKCMVTLTGVADGCFPYRGDDGSLYFPEDGEPYQFDVTGYELMCALEHNAIRHMKIQAVRYYYESMSFAEFIDENWKRRKAAQAAGNDALSLIVKLLMNSAYGKFASDYNKYREYVLCHREEMAEYLSIGFEMDSQWSAGKYLMKRKIPEDKQRFFNIATASSITGFVRAMQYSAYRQVTGALYGDTDSLACANTGKLELGKELGQWKIEGEFDEYAIAGKKTYCFKKKGAPRTDDRDSNGKFKHWKLASKGVALAPSQIILAAQGEVIRHNPLVPTYSAKRAEPVYTAREVRRTAKDIRYVRH